MVNELLRIEKVGAYLFRFEVLHSSSNLVGK